MTSWLTPSERVRLASQLVHAFQEQFNTLEFKAVLKQFGIATERPQGFLFHTFLEDSSDDQLAELGLHFELELPEKPVEQEGHSLPDHIDAYAELVSAETALREVVRLAIPNWIQSLNEDDVAKLTKKRIEEDKRRDGITVSQDLLDYTETHQLLNFISKHWESGVKEILADKKRTDVYLSLISDVRNTISHSRPVQLAERQLLAGAGGQIRNQLAVFRGKTDGPHRHYPSLDSARDSMGNTAAPDRSLAGPFTVPWSDDVAPRIPRLEVGDTITFDLEGTDPRGRELIWRLHAVPYGYAPSLFSNFPLIEEAAGNRVQINWTVSKHNVGESLKIVVTLANSGPYHRQHEYDDACLFTYHVNPPIND